MPVDDLQTINATLGGFCFRNGAPLVQFVQCVGTATSLVRIMTAISDAPRQPTDSWETWVARCQGLVP